MKLFNIIILLFININIIFADETCDRNGTYCLYSIYEVTDYCANFYDSYACNKDGSVADGYTLVSDNGCNKIVTKYTWQGTSDNYDRVSYYYGIFETLDNCANKPPEGCPPPLVEQIIDDRTICVAPSCPPPDFPWVLVLEDVTKDECFTAVGQAVERAEGNFSASFKEFPPKTCCYAKDNNYNGGSGDSGDNNSTNGDSGDNNSTNGGSGDNNSTNGGSGDNNSTNGGSGDNNSTNGGSGDNNSTNGDSGDSGGSGGSGDSEDSGDSGDGNYTAFSGTPFYCTMGYKGYTLLDEQIVEGEESPFTQKKDGCIVIRGSRVDTAVYTDKNPKSVFCCYGIPSDNDDRINGYKKSINDDFKKILNDADKVVGSLILDKVNIGQDYSCNLVYNFSLLGQSYTLDVSRFNDVADVIRPFMYFASIIFAVMAVFKGD